MIANLQLRGKGNAIKKKRKMKIVCETYIHLGNPHIPPLTSKEISLVLIKHETVSWLSDGIHACIP